MDLKTRNQISPDFSMSSMTDIVFLLLIFYMLTSTMVSTNVLNLELPKANGVAAEQQTVIVNINNNGEYFIGKEPVAKETLESVLKEKLSGETEPQFILQAEEKTFTKDIVYVMDIANRNQIKMVLATAPNGEE